MPFAQHNVCCPVCSTPSPPSMRFPGFCVYQCNNCLHEFSTDFAPGAKAVYSLSYFNETHANWFNNPDLGLFSLVEGILLERFSKNLRLIDIGCGTGNFLRYLSQRGFTDISGLDILDQEIPGVCYHCTPVEDFRPESKYDAVVSIANIEHLVDVRTHAEQLKSMLNPGGLALVYTNDSRSLIYLMAKAMFSLGIPFAAARLYDSHHLNHFSVSSLARLFIQAGFTPHSLVRRTIPANAVDLPAVPLRPVLAAGIAVIGLAASLLRRQMFQLAVFITPCSSGLS